MAIRIGNPLVEANVRRLAALTGQSLVQAINSAVTARLLALEQSLEHPPTPPKPRATVAEMIAATEKFRKAIGLDKREIDGSKAFFDDLWAESEGLERSKPD